MFLCINFHSLLEILPLHLVLLLWLLLRIITILIMIIIIITFTIIFITKLLLSKNFLVVFHGVFARANFSSKRERRRYQWVKSLLTEGHFSASIHTYQLLKWQNLRCTFLSNLFLPSLLVEIQQIQIIITVYSVALRVIDWLLSLR